jgi:DNA primase
MNKEQIKALQDFINKSFSIVDVIESYGFSPRKETDDRYGMRCPFHNEKTGSFKIYVGTNRFHCFGCDQSGSVVEFMMGEEGLDRQEVLDRFKDDIDVTSSKFAVDTILKNISKPRIDPVRHSDEIDFELRVYLRDWLKKHPGYDSVVDDCLKDMNMFFNNPDNTDVKEIDIFATQIMKRAKV